MKEGSFVGQVDDLDFSDEWSSGKLPADKVPLPTEVPRGIDLSQVPANIVRSGVIDALVNQNEDLMSRLGVALRRVALLEEKVSDSRLETEQFRIKYENLNDQLLILKEKSRSLSERKDRDEGEYQTLKDQIQLLEIRYAELYTTTESKESNLLKQFEGQDKRARRLERYRTRVRRAVASLKKSARDKWDAEVRLAQSEISQDNLRKNLAESAEYISNLTRENKNQLSELTNLNENRVRELHAQLEETIAQNARLAERVTDYDALVEAKIRLENEIILVERREEEIRIQTAAEVSDLQKGLGRYRNEAKELAIELESTVTELQRKNEDIAAANEQIKAFEEQVENLQILWRDNQEQIEKVNEKNRSLQKLNQELSIAINQYRREIRDLKEKADTDSLKQIEKSAASITVTTGTPKAAQLEGGPELLQKIDSAFADIHR